MLASDGHFRYKASSGAAKVRVGKVIYFWRNEGENTKFPTGDLVTFNEIYHKESEEVLTIPVADITVRILLSQCNSTLRTI